MVGLIDPIALLGLNRFIGLVGVSSYDFLMNAFESAHILMNKSIIIHQMKPR